MAQHQDVGSLADYERLKRELVGSLTGAVLEIGAGRGSNLELLRPDTDWVGLEPSARRRRQLEARLAAKRRVHPGLGRRETVEGVAERLPFADGELDAVLSTITLCSVRDPQQAVAEARRVLRPGGRFVFFEHVGSPRGSWRRRAERWYAPLSRLVDAGCDPSRETWLVLEQAGFAELDLRWFHKGGNRLIGGQATR